MSILLYAYRYVRDTLEVSMRLGLRVIELLNEKGLKQADLATYLKTKPSTISGWKLENRNPSAEMILPICEFFSITPTFLLTGKDDKTLSTRESELLNIFRSLPDNLQDECVGLIKGYSMAHNKDNHMESIIERKNA